MPEDKYEELCFRAIRDGLIKGVAKQLDNHYSTNPMATILADCVKSRSGELILLLNEAITAAISEQKFREEIATQVRAVLAKQIVQKFGGELEKQVNTLKSDPTTRARITLAIEEIMKSKATS
jgi:hypothetical protein